MNYLVAIQLCYLIRSHYPVFTTLDTHTHSSDKHCTPATSSFYTDPGEVSDRELPNNRQIPSSSADTDNE